MALNFEIDVRDNKSNGLDYVAYPMNLRDKHRGIAGYGDTQREAVNDLFDAIEERSIRNITRDDDASGRGSW